MYLTKVQGVLHLFIFLLYYSEFMEDQSWF